MAATFTCGPRCALMPTHMRNLFQPEELQDIQIAPPFSFTKGCRTMKIKGRTWINPHDFGSLLFDLETDPRQERPLQAPAIEERLIREMVRLMRANDAPAEQFERLGLSAPLRRGPGAPPEAAQAAGRQQRTQGAATGENGPAPSD